MYIDIIGFFFLILCTSEETDRRIANLTKAAILDQINNNKVRYNCVLEFASVLMLHNFLKKKPNFETLKTFVSVDK